ncbi:CCR4-NOT transcription complex [Capsaspora owczarzaki ATCC 30864]|uniref:poly(A)-specific ribonuclease n=1 Tax=Capsaspora owczarzaki (strain ATCC 30864) TaxID=595528 RepID=A0A0D2WWP4_CAPO3|nr:CCR4-NOT transcription complex [Capsaspora owczarzaki ATCC 30864]KJE97425.1 CCR4-NOT transcription complex [Capsaspora owczarzaki ATCC 30864]|eukprot:XP_004343146.1 CCR4-NOT transcription complex [Capsaspora owczarzaki ATCC 30864]
MRFEADGIDVHHFAELLIPSGIVLNDQIKWISFHSGYDFAYLLKVLTCTALPTEESDFFSLLYLYFPCIYDIKFMMRSCKHLKGGLQDVSDDLEVERYGPQHQAGSDSMLTAFAFFKMRQLFFEDNIDDSKFQGHIYGLGTSYLSKLEGPASSATTPATSGAPYSPSTTPGAGSNGTYAASSALGTPPSNYGLNGGAKPFSNAVPQSPSTVMANNVVNARKY